jgi:hypothetical protein
MTNMAHSEGRRQWTLLTSHGHVLVEIARDPNALIKEISSAAAITERAAAKIIAELEAEGYVTRERQGRRNRYVVHGDRPFRDPAHRDMPIGPFLALLTQEPALFAPPGAFA